MHNYHRSTRLIIIHTCLLIGGTISKAQHGGIHWFDDLKQGSEAARQTNRPIMIDFWSDGCAPCKKMDLEVYTNPAVIKAITQRIIAVRLNYDTQEELAQKYNVEALPYLVFANSYGTELMHNRGFLEAHVLAAVVSALPSDVSELNRLDRALQRNKNDFELLVMLGSHLRAAGFFASSSEYLTRALKQDQAKKQPVKREAVLTDIGLNFLELKDGKQAAQIFERCLKEFPASDNRPNVLLNLARAYGIGDQKEKARKVLKSLMAEFPQTDASVRAKTLAASL